MAPSNPWYRRVGGPIQSLVPESGWPHPIRPWEAVSGIPHIRAEIHDDRQVFLAAIGAWNGRASMDPDNAYLGIYAHMGGETGRDGETGTRLVLTAIRCFGSWAN